MKFRKYYGRLEGGKTGLRLGRVKLWVVGCGLWVYVVDESLWVYGFMSSYKPSDKPQICFSKEINPTAKGDINFYKLVDEVDEFLRTK